MFRFKSKVMCFLVISMILCLSGCRYQYEDDYIVPNQNATLIPEQNTTQMPEQNTTQDNLQNAPEEEAASEITLTTENILEYINITVSEPKVEVELNNDYRLSVTSGEGSADVTAKIYPKKPGIFEDVVIEMKLILNEYALEHGWGSPGDEEEKVEKIALPFDGRMEVDYHMDVSEMNEHMVTLITDLVEIEGYEILSVEGTFIED